MDVKWVVALYYRSMDYVAVLVDFVHCVSLGCDLSIVLNPYILDCANLTL